MFLTSISPTNNLTLDEVIARLAQHDVVDGVLLMGSTGAGALTPTSDYDVFVALRVMPTPIFLALTTINGRLAEVYFDTVEMINQIVDRSEPVSSEDYEAAIITWLQYGRVVWDRAGRLARAQAITQTKQLISTRTEAELQATWFNINYNYRHNKLISTSSEPVYHIKLDLRLLFSVHDLWTHYFRVRQLVWQGHTASIQYMMQHDLEYFALFQRCVAETNRQNKFALYEQLAQLTLAPVGGLWADGQTNVQPDRTTPLQPGMVDAALQFWESLVR